MPDFPKLHGMHPHPLQIEEEERSKILILEGQFFQREVKEFFGKMKKIIITEWKKTTVIYFKGVNKRGQYALKSELGALKLLTIYVLRKKTMLNF